MKKSVKAINADHILDVQAFRSRPETSSQYREEFKGDRFIFMWLSRPLPAGYGYERSATQEEWIKAQHREDMYVARPGEGHVFVKARVVIRYIGGKYASEETEYFDSDEEALAKLKLISSRFPHVIVNGWDQ
jgi:hypothetical protein